MSAPSSPFPSTSFTSLPQPAKLLPSKPEDSLSDNVSASLTTSERHRKIRQAADQEYRKNAEKMKIQYSKRKRHCVKVYAPGDSVTLRIPKNERSSSDMPRLLCRVIQVKGKYMYRLE